jgi:nicotinamidase-related amidase
MPKNDEKRNGRSEQALLIVDMINHFQYDGGDVLFKRALPVAKKIVNLRERAYKAGVPVIYVNDNFAKWHDTFQTTIASVENESDQAREIVSIVQPGKDDYYVLKPHLSGFYKTPLEVLLGDLGTREVVLTGITADMCVLFTAYDAHMRGFEIVVPSDCTTAVENSHKAQALDLLRRVADADTRASNKVRFRGHASNKKK